MKINKKINYKKGFGFTLVELLVVISIMGILTIIVSSGFVTSQQRSRDAARKANLKSLSDALNLYYADTGVFPTAAYINGLILSEGEFSTVINPSKTVVYMKKVPKEAVGGMKQFTYEVSRTFKSFRIYANLENGEDNDCLKDSGGVNLTVVNGYSITGYSITKAESCIYVVTSSNASINSLP